MRGFKWDSLEPRKGYRWIENAGKPQPLTSMNGICCEKSASRPGAGKIANMVGQDVRVRRMERATPRKETKNDLSAAKREEYIL